MWCRQSMVDSHTQTKSRITIKISIIPRIVCIPQQNLPSLLMQATWENACCHVGRVARTEIAVRIVVSGSVVYRRAPTLFVPFPSTPPTPHPHGSPYPPPKPRNLETPCRKSCKLLPARQSRGYRATVRTGKLRKISAWWESRGDASSSTKTRRLTPRKTHRDQFLRLWTAECDCISATCGVPPFLAQSAISALCRNIFF